jgi:POT family proton-dependent oligopeptide transporter
MTTASTTADTRHPKGLYVLFFTEMWERFSYYGMRALLVLYLVNFIQMERSDALEIYAIFTGLVYLTPILGGMLADTLLGQRKAIFIGGILMALGQFALAAGPAWLNLGLGLIIMGNGFFKPNISTIVGSLYKENDPRRDGGFTIFYMGINLGAFLSPLICGYLGEKVDWSLGFAAAGIGMLLGVLIFYWQGQVLGEAGFPPARKTSEEKKYIVRDWLDIAGFVVGIAALVFAFVQLWPSVGEDIRGYITNGLVIVAIIGLIVLLVRNIKTGDEWSRVAVIFILAFFNVFFWAGFEQAGGTFNLFADKNTDRIILGSEVPASSFQSVNAILIFTIAPLFSMLWIWLASRQKEPNTPMKFSFGLVLLGLGFVVMSAANALAKDGTLVSPLWLVMVYLLHTLGELCLSPVGLSMITKLAPPKLVSLMMGLWFSSIALANYMAGILESILQKFELELFTFLTITSLSAGFVLLLISPLLKKAMKGIH